MMPAVETRQEDAARIPAGLDVVLVLAAIGERLFMYDRGWASHGF